MNWPFIFREGFRGLGRNLTMTIALVITTGLSLALVGSGILFSQVTSKTKELYLDRVEAKIELAEEVSANDKDCSSQPCREIRDMLQADDRVETVTYRNRDQTYEHFAKTFGESDPELVRETRPESLNATLYVKLVDPLDSSPIDPVRDLPQVVYVGDPGTDLDSAAKSMDSFRNATFLIAAAQALAAIFLIANMVQLAAYNRRDEISIMRMVGASRWFTQAPFILEAVLSVALGAILATVGVWFTKAQVIDPMLTPLYESLLIAKLPDSAVWTVMPLVGIGSLVVAALVAQVALRSYVRK